MLVIMVVIEVVVRLELVVVRIVFSGKSLVVIVVIVSVGMVGKMFASDGGHFGVVDILVWWW